MEHINKCPYNNINGNNYAADDDDKAPYIVVVQSYDHINIDSATTDCTT